METLLFTCAVVLMIVGVAGTVIPFLPGTTLILAAAVVHRFLAGPEAGASWYLLGWLVLLYIISLLVDFVSGMIGAKRFGASRLGIIGGFVGTIVGIFLGLPGIFLGPLTGAVVGEALAMREPGRICKAGFGTFLGTVLGIAGRLTVGVLMLVSFVAGLILFRR